ncbi:MAG: family 1 glycosylhydrolase, partial [Candidatus Omnitrophota bacterium]|nr:family 1 glycosylhydrolase [Candidatus Omnitrophota bacterium]
LGNWPPQEKSFFKAWKVARNFCRGHVKAYRLIHRVYQSKGLVRPLVGIAHNLQAFQPCIPTLRNRFAACLRSRAYNFSFLKKLARQRSMDFIGINYYTRGLAETRSWSISSLLLDNCQSNHSQLKKNSLGWDIYPQGLFQALLELKKFHLPVFILENGICTADDNLRWEFISGHLQALHQAMLAGVEVLGYLYWSLIDNFEWDKGFGPRFGLAEVDYDTYKRTARGSAGKFAEVCKTGVLA